MKLQIFIFLALIALLAPPALEAITPAMPDLVIEKTTQTSPDFWSVRVKNVGNGDALMLNYPSRAYLYEDPDHYRLPWDTPEIPYVWKVGDRMVTRRDPAT